MRKRLIRLLTLLLLVSPAVAIAQGDDKTETQSVLYDKDGKELSSSGLIKLLNDKLDGVYQDLELIITACFGGEVASRAAGPKRLKGDWSVSTATDIDHKDTTIAGTVAGAGNFNIGGRIYNGWLPAWISRVTAAGNQVGNKDLATYATAEKNKAIRGSAPQYASSGKAADDMTVHGGTASNHAILFQTTGYTKVLDGVKTALKSAGYADAEINLIPDKDLTWEKFGAALDALRPKLDEHPKDEKVLISLQTHGGKEQRTVAYAPGHFGEAGGGAVVSADDPLLPVRVTDPVVLAALGEELLMSGGGFFSDDPTLTRYGPATLRFSTLDEFFIDSATVGIEVNDFEIGTLDMGTSTGGDYQIQIPDSILSLVLGDVAATGLLNVGFDFSSPGDWFRLATDEDWLSDSYLNLDYGIGIAANCCEAVPEPPIAGMLLLAFALWGSFGLRCRFVDLRGAGK